jgi:starch phosphorylase
MMVINMNQARDAHRVPDSSSFATGYQRTLRLALAKDESMSTDYDAYLALASLCREQLIDRWLETEKRYTEDNVKRVSYLSMEFLMGRYLQNVVLNMDLEDSLRDAMYQQGMVLEDIYDQEFDPGLGNGGLGRLAACFLDSMATLDIPAVGYGIRYEYGIFRQEIRNGSQVEHPDNWLYRGNPWEIARPEEMVPVRFHGSCESYVDSQGHERRRWRDYDVVMALPHDTPVPGYDTRTINKLRLWQAQSNDEFDLHHFNSGDYLGAVRKKTEDETISKVLYPADDSAQGQELRLKQQYFFVAASLSDILNGFLLNNRDLRSLPDKVAIQLNDTHPAIAVPELMRLLVDEHDVAWDTAWDITRRTMAYTNHTLLPEALECWSVELLEDLLPRHLEIIYTINHHFLEPLQGSCQDETFISRISIIQESPVKMVRMAHLAIVGSHSTNGVAALHTRLLKQQVMPELESLFPERFNNKTNGVTPRRWLKQANPALSLLISGSLGSSWVRDLDQLNRLKPLAEDPAFRESWRGCKLSNKIVFADYLARQQSVNIDPESMFDVQVKRIHEYKRQLLNLLQVIAYYFRIKEGLVANPVPRTVLIGGKAAPSYAQAKLIIRLACAVGDVINADSQVNSFLRVVFLENYGVSLAERIFPASDLSEQISTAGFEASGTGNMKFAMNGALTIGTMDGANVEIAEAVGKENMFVFGLSADEILARKQNGYNLNEAINKNQLLGEVLEALRGDLFSRGEAGLFEPLYDGLVHQGDYYMVLADFADYCRAQDRVSDLYRTPDEWTRKAILNVAGMGSFSCDRTIREYARDIWDIPST